MLILVDWKEDQKLYNKKEKGQFMRILFYNKSYNLLCLLMERLNYNCPFNNKLMKAY